MIKGDLHCHSSWSDGGSPLEEMMITAQALGHSYCAITDHSPRLKVARGLTAERLREQQEVITDLNDGLGAVPGAARHRGRHPRGRRLDQEDGLLAELDVVVASVHSKLRSDSETMTHRMVAAIANPRTNVLGHCTGRLIEGERGLRPQSSFDAEVVFEACRSFDVAVEINSRPSAGIRRPGCCGWPWRWAVCSPSTPTRTRPDSSSSRSTAASGPSRSGWIRIG